MRLPKPVKPAKNILLDTNRWREMDFGQLPSRHRYFLIVLECLADKAGVVPWDLERINEVAGDGADFNRVDVHKLGRDNAVWMDGGVSLLLSQYMKRQYSQLSRDCRPHIQVWQAIERHWGRPKEPSEPEPFIAWFEERGIRRHAPPIKNEDQGIGDVPGWKKRIIEELGQLDELSIPKSIPKIVYDAMTDLFEWRREVAMKSITQSEGHKWSWTKRQANQDIDQIQRMLKTYTPEAIEENIRNSIRTNSLYLNKPKDFKCNLLPNKKDETEP
jgi:hypothetical protein